MNETMADADETLETLFEISDWQEGASSSRRLKGPHGTVCGIVVPCR